MVARTSCCAASPTPTASRGPWTAPRCYCIDTPTLVVQVFDYDHATGNIANPRVVICIPEGSGGPAGMTIDAEGQRWVALWAGRVYRYDPVPGHCCRSLRCPCRSFRRVLSAGRGSKPSSLPRRGATSRRSKWLIFRSAATFLWCGRAWRAYRPVFWKVA